MRTIPASLDSRSANPWFPLYLSRLPALVDPTTDVKDKLDQELRWMEEVTSDIKTRLNALSSPIARMSPELLACVFRHLAYLDPPSGGFSSSSGLQEISLGWMRVTHVCWLWRSIALDYPDLWGRGNICFPSVWTEERLRRSKQAPFDVRGKTGVPISPSVVASVSRMREFYIYSYDPWDSEDISHRDLLTSPAPSLLSFTYIREYRTSGVSGPLDELPDNIFARNAPRLGLLHLESIMLPFESPLYDNLAHLTFINVHDTQPPFNRTQLLELLLRIPRLETLNLRRTIPDKALEDPRPESDADSLQAPVFPSSVPLARLKEIDLAGDTWSCLWLAERLSIPAAASFRIAGQLPSALWDQATIWDGFVPIMIRHFSESRRLQSTPTLSVILHPKIWQLTALVGLLPDALYNYVSPNFGFWDGRLEGDIYAPVNLRFKRDDAVPIIPAAQFLRPFLAAIRTVNIRNLHFSATASHLYCPEWLDLFASFTALEHLSVEGMVAVNLVQALGLDLTINLRSGAATLGHTPSPEPQVLFPALRSLEFILVDFTCFVDAADARLSDITISFLTERRELNQTLREIALVRCRWRDHWVKTLKEIGFQIHDRYRVSEPRFVPMPLYDEVIH